MLVLATDDCIDPSRFVGSLKEKVWKRDINSGILENSGLYRVQQRKARLPLAESHWHTGCFLRNVSALHWRLKETRKRDGNSKKGYSDAKSRQERIRLCCWHKGEFALYSELFAGISMFLACFQPSNKSVSRNISFLFEIILMPSLAYHLVCSLSNKFFFLVYNLSLFPNRVNSHKNEKFVILLLFRRMFTLLFPLTSLL